MAGIHSKYIVPPGFLHPSAPNPRCWQLVKHLC